MGTITFFLSDLMSWGIDSSGSIDKVSYLFQTIFLTKFITSNLLNQQFIETDEEISDSSFNQVLILAKMK